MMKIFTESDNLTSTVLWKYGLMIFVIAVLTTSVGWAKSSQLETLGVEENEGPRPFITIWKTDNPGSSADNQITIPADPTEDLALVYNYDIYWEDVNDANINGAVSGLTGDYTIDFPDAGTYRVEITGEFPKIFFNNTGDKSKILAVEQWGDIVWGDMQYSFYGCNNIAINASDAPDLSIVTNMRGMFRASSINQNINHWDVSSVTDMSQLFRDAISFNQALSNWNVGNVITKGQMFMNAEEFNQNIGNWDISGAANLAGMFSGATNFNQDISGWDVSNVERMNNMFNFSSSFNQDISGWDVSNVTDMSLMFRNATNFNQPIGIWDVRNVSEFIRMFQNATNFNSDINQWAIEKTTDLSHMFSGAISFNQDLSQWDVSNVSKTENMFLDAINFDQDISSWNVSNATNMLNMLKNSGLSPYNFDALLRGWLENGVQDSLTFQVHGLKYCQGITAINELKFTHGWTIIGEEEDCSQVIVFDILSAKTFGDPDFKLEGKVSSGAPIHYTSSDENVAVISGDSVKIIGAGTTTIMANRPKDGDYEAALSVSRELKINKADQVIVFETIPAKTIGDGTFDLLATTHSGLDITFASSNESVAKVEENTVTIIGPGTVVITAFQEGNENYHAADPAEQILQVNKKSQSIVFEPMLSKTILDDELDLTAVASSGLNVVYTSSNELVATVVGNKVTIIGLGTTTITASQAGNAEYEAATTISQDLTVTKAPQEITFEPIEDRSTDAPNFEIIASASSGLPIVFTVNGPAAIEGNEISLKGTPGVVSVTATQAGDDIYSNAEPVVRTFEVLAAPVTGVQDLRKEGISIYPNPVYDRLIIDLAKANQAVIYVSDAGGNIVMEERLVGASNQLDVSSLNSGLYFIKIQLADKVLYHKVVKE